MCKAMEDMRNETELETKRKIAHTLVLTGELSHEMIAEVTELSIEEIEALAINESGKRV